MLRSRRYRNRRLGDFLKELDLTEGRATGIPTIQKKLRENGSPKATIETDDSRSYFLIDIPARKDFVQDVDRIKESDIERIKLNMSKMCPRCVQDMSMNELGLLAICLLRAQEDISAQDVEVPAPNEDGRREILKIHTRKMNLSKDIDMDLIVSLSEGCSGADLKAICTEAGMFAIREERDTITNADFMDAIDKTRGTKHEVDFEKEAGVMFG